MGEEKAIGKEVMRIISKFHDYYDCIQRMGQDQSIIYLRERKTINEWPFPGCRGSYKSSWSSTGDLTRQKVVGFCGKVYPLIEFRTDFDSDWVQCWNVDDVDKFMETNLDHKGWEAYHKNKWTRGYVYNRRRQHFQKFFGDFTKNYEYLFREHHSPLFVATAQWKYKNTLVFNDRLQDVNFMTKFDPYTAFQEIAMYLGGVLGSHGGHKTKYQGEPMSSEVSDRDLLEAKGFNKNSFRNVR